MGKDIAMKQLSRFKEYGESVIQELDCLSQIPLPDGIPAELPNCIQRIRQAATKTIEQASSAVKIGVMGEFNSGKTLLLGSLFGYADALPISDTPTTGNVTAIRLVQQSDFQTTQIHPFTIEYLSYEGVKDCLRFMLQEVYKRGKRAGLPEIQLEVLADLDFNKADVWEKILQWSKQAWNSGKNLDLRYLLRELVIFTRTYLAYGAAICGRSYPIDSITAKEGLTLPDPQMNFQELRFEDLPIVTDRWQHPPERLLAKNLQSSFSLIRRVDVTVEVSKEIWDLSPLRETNEFMMLDFPGLGAANSGVRDAFLSLRELEEVQTILILLNGKTPGSDEANKIFNMMEEKRRGEDLKDRILVGVGRFDQLPLEDDGGERTLEELIGNGIFVEEESLSEESVLNRLKVLKNIIAGSQAFTNQTKRIILLSPRLYLADLAGRFTTVQVGSPKFLDDLEYDNFLKKKNPLRQKWRQLSKRLQESNPHSSLGRQLSDFAEDGGIGRLRELIRNHVTTHGLELLYVDTRKSAQTLQKAQEDLHTILEEYDSSFQVEQSPVFSTLRQSIQNLEKTYRNFKENLEKKPLQNRRGQAISRLIKDELFFRVYNWHEWGLLFNRIKDGIIPLENPEPKPTDEWLHKRRTRSSEAIPSKSDDFYLPFEKTVMGLQIFTQDRIQEAVKDLLDNLLAQVSEPSNSLREIVVPELESLIEQNPDFGNEEVNLFKDFLDLLDADDPKQWREAIIEKNNSEDNHLSTLNPETIFPLARSDRKHKIGQIFDWAPEAKKWNQGKPKPINHQILVLRLRDELIASANLHLNEVISEMTKQVKTRLAEILFDISSTLQNLSKNEALLRYIATGKEQGGVVTPPKWLQILHQLTSIPYPD